MNNNRFQRLITYLSRSRFFTISVALHFLLVLSLGTLVLVKQIKPRNDFEDSSGGELVAQPPTAPEEQVQPIQPSNPESVPTNAALSPALSASALSVNSLNSSSFSISAAPATSVPVLKRDLAVTASQSSVSTPKIGNIPTEIAKGIAATVRGWRAAGDSGSGVNKERAFKFTAYIAKYAGGDWDSTVRHKTVGKDTIISMGSMTNLLYFIRKTSRDRVDAEIEPQPLDIGSDELLAKKPPFVFFTGHQDFTLNAKEIDNLQKYLQLGGAVWGDSSLPGNRSRFDIAFRREMKRVLPDEDIVWTSLPPDHGIYTKTYFNDIRAVPSGLNYYQEPVYALKRFDEIAVIYTANDYGDMWQIGIDERGQYDTRRDENGHYTAINGSMFDKREVYFRNLENKPLFDSYKFGTNIILHMLTRWDDKMRNVPQL